MSARMLELFAEQDAIMALPEEDSGDYLQRIRTIWNPPRGKRWSDLHHEEETHLSTAVNNQSPGQRTDHNAIRESVSNDDLHSPEDCVPEADKVPGSSIKANPGSRVAPEESNAEPIDADVVSSDVAEIPTSPIESNGEGTSVPQIRRTRDSGDDEPASKKRRLSPSSAANNEETADLISLICPPSTPPKAALPSKRKARAAVDQPPQLPYVPAIERSPPLKRARTRTKPTQETPKKFSKASDNSKTESKISSSPIEDPSLILSRPKQERRSRALESQPSELLMEVKERVARHKASKQRMKTVPLGKANTSTAIQAAQSIEDSSIIYMSSSGSSRASSPIPQYTVPDKTTKRKLVDPVLEKRKEKATTKNKKEKPKPMIPSEYAIYIQTDGAEDSKPRRKSSSRFLEGYKIFYTGGDMHNASETTRRRMELIVRHGGTLMPTFDPQEVTHIVTDAGKQATLRALGVKNLSDIPNHIPTVKWTWVTSGMGLVNAYTKTELDEKLRDDLWQHAGFGERLEAGMKITKSLSKASLNRKGKEKSEIINADGDVSRFSEFTQEKSVPPQNESDRSPAVSSDAVNNEGISGGTLPSPPSSQSPPIVKRTSSSKVTLDVDPLAQYYDQAKAEQMQELEEKSQLRSEPGTGSDDESDKEEEIPAFKPKKRGWTCDNKQAVKATNSQNPNQDIIDKLKKLKGLHEAKAGEEEKWRVFTYSKILRILQEYPKRINSFKEAISIPGVGTKTAQKIMEIIETGDLRRIGYENTEEVQVSSLFQGIYGVGRSVALQWYKAGCRTLKDLKGGKGGVKLSPAQEIGLRFYDDINERMPREEAKAIYELIKPIALSLDPNLFIEIMGSYRRGKTTCGDIDIMVTRPPDDGKTHAGILPRLLHELHAVGILTEDLAVPEDPHELECVYRGLCRLPSVPNSKRRRIDFLTVPYRSRGAALIYYTGDDIFNRAMRLKANVMGYSLNQKGLFGQVVRDPRDRRVKLHDGVLVASETEEEIFEILGVPWQEPHERVRG